MGHQEIEFSESYFCETMSLAKKGDRDALGRLWRYFNPKLIRYLRIVLSSEWEDVASETWIGLARAIPKFRGDSRAFESLMFTVARRRVVDHVRRVSSRPETSQMTSESLERSLGPEEVAVSKDSLGEILDILRRLPPSQAEVVTLRIISGLEISEIAQIVEKTPGAVRVLSHRGLVALSLMTEMDGKMSVNAIPGVNSVD